jgi:hypothetical protein
MQIGQSLAEIMRVMTLKTTDMTHIWPAFCFVGTVKNELPSPTRLGMLVFFQFNPIKLILHCIKVDRFFDFFNFA